MGDSAQTTRFITFLPGSFGLLALLLASRGDILAAATLRALRPVLAGIGAGVTAAFYASRLLESVLFDVPTRDPLTFAGAPIVLGLVGLAAALLPALRASRVDPVRVMRSSRWTVAGEMSTTVASSS